MSNFVSRGFQRRRHTPEELADRVPPGQYVERGFPVLTAGPTPHVDTEAVAVQDRRHGRHRAPWTWDEFHELPFETVPCDIHCVTKWSKLGTSFGGVSVDTLLDGVDTQGAYTMAYSYGGYTTNVPLADLTGGKAWVVTEHEGEPLPREHGGPGAPARPPSLLLEEREVGRRPARDRPRRARLLGGERLPHPRRPLEGGALLERLSPVELRAPGRLADRHRHGDQAGDAERQVVPLPRADVDGAPARPALRRAAHRRPTATAPSARTRSPRRRSTWARSS